MDDSPKSKGKRMLPWFIEWEKRAMNVRAEGWNRMVVGLVISVNK